MVNFAPAHIEALQIPHAKQVTQAACDQSKRQWDGAKQLLAKLGIRPLTQSPDKPTILISAYNGPALLKSLDIAKHAVQLQYVNACCSDRCSV